jgi:type VI secretion system protein ImpM
VTGDRASGGRGLFARLLGGGGGDAARPKPITLTHVGFCGKVPFAGDFIARGLPAAERERLEDFLLGGLQVVGGMPGFAESWAVMPIWRFAARPGALTQAMCIGIVLPSVDRVGRQFPLAVLALAAPGVDADPDAMLTASAPFLAAAEAAALAALDPSAPPDAAFAEIMQRRELPPPARAVSGGAACVWETDGGLTGAPARLPSTGKPNPGATMKAMLAAGGDPQAAMQSFDAAPAMFAAPPATAEASMFGSHPVTVTPAFDDAPATERGMTETAAQSPAQSTEDRLFPDPASVFADAVAPAPAIAAPPAPVIVPEASEPMFPDSPAPVLRDAPEPPLFPEPTFDEEPDLFPRAAPAPESAPETTPEPAPAPEPTPAPVAQRPAPAPIDNVFAAAFQSLDAEKATGGQSSAATRNDAGHASESTPSEGASADGGDRS